MNPAVYTSIVLPHKLLKPYIRHYAIRCFDTQGYVFPKAIIATGDIEINFFIKGKLFGFDGNSTHYQWNKNNIIECYFTGLQASTKGFVLFNGITNILTVHFKPTGFYNIFDISPKELTDVYGETSPVLGNDINLLYEQMCEADDVCESIAIIQTYLIKKLLLRKRMYRHLSIKTAADLLTKRKGICSIAKLTDALHITQQTLEIQFRNQVGVDPKTFCRLLRFNHAFKLKIYDPHLKWTSIAYACGFYDQMHMIKDFKNLTGLSPKEFILNINPPVENFLKDRS
ncbi:MAG: helix-turn-helix domain-containing protein [Gelidibacter sp.]